MWRTPTRTTRSWRPKWSLSCRSASLILADLGYFAFAWFDALTDRGYYWLSRLRNKTSYETLHVFYQDRWVVDALVWLGAYRADRAAHAVRLVSLRLGDRTYQYVTNVLDPLQLTPLAIVRLYGRRWDIEMAFNLVKTHLGLHLLWSSKLVVILQQVWAVLIIAQILQALHLEIAGRAGRRSGRGVHGASGAISTVLRPAWPGSRGYLR